MDGEIDYEEYIQLKYQLTYDLRLLTDNVNRMTSVFEKRLDAQENRICTLEQNSRNVQSSQGAKGGVTGGTSSLPSNIKWLLLLICGIALLGTLGAAIGINLLEYFKAGAPV